MTDHSRRAESAFDHYYGLRVVACTADETRGELDVQPHHLQPTGVVHGGVYCSIAEALASFGTNQAVASAGAIGLGASNHTSFMRPATCPSTLTAVAEPRHRGRTSWIWDVTITNPEGRTCAISRVTVAVRNTVDDASRNAPAGHDRA